MNAEGESPGTLTFERSQMTEMPGNFKVIVNIGFILIRSYVYIRVEIYADSDD